MEKASGMEADLVRNRTHWHGARPSSSPKSAFGKNSDAASLINCYEKKDTYQMRACAEPGAMIMQREYSDPARDAIH